jgi:hypothetical protein
VRVRRKGIVDVMTLWWRLQEPGEKKVLSMTDEVDQLVEDLHYLRSNAGSVGPDHPKAQKWITEVRGFLGRQGKKSGLREFERLEFVKSGAGMWRRQNITETDIGRYKADLGKVGAILENMAEPSDQLSADQKMRELFMSPENTEDETLQEAEGEKAEKAGHEGETEIARGPAVIGKPMGEEIEPDFETVTEQHLSVSNRERTVDHLLEELGAEMKSLDPDWEKIQQVMGALLGLKRTEELVERLSAQAKNPEVKWEPIRKLMLQLWSIKKDLVIDLLPSLLGR